MRKLSLRKWILLPRPFILLPSMLTILIPTYNRSSFLKKNLQQLCSWTSQHRLENDIEILVANNVSPDDTVSQVQKVQEEWPSVNLVLHTHEKNIGSVRNVLFLLNQATTKYVLYVADDDYISENFLLEIIKLAREGEVGLVVPSNQAVSTEGQLLGYGRDTDFPSRRLSAGFKACLFFAWRGHQMSGLLFLREGLAELCRKHDIENMYLFVYLVGVSALRRPSVHLTEYPVLISTPSQEEKGWSYGDDGMIGEVFVNYARMEGVGSWDRFRLEMKFLWEQYWRYAMYVKKGLPAFFKCLWKIISGPDTSLITRIVFPLSLPLIVLGKIIQLSVTGQLKATLQRKVDI